MGRMSGHPSLLPAAFAAMTVLSLSVSSVAQQPKVLAPHRPIPPRVEKRIQFQGADAGQRSMAGGLWMTDPNTRSSIYVRNVVETDSITTTPILYLSNGNRYVLPDVAVEPAGVAIISINDELEKQGISSKAPLSGYVELDYKWPWDPFCATVRSIDTAHSTIFNFALRGISPLPLQTDDPPPPPTKTLDGMWWKQGPNVTGFVAIANLSADAVQASVQLTDEMGQTLSQHDVSVSPHGMKLIQLDELQSIKTAQGGIRVSSSTTMDQLVVQGGLEDQATGYSAALPFAVEGLSAKSAPVTVAEVGLMVGAADPMMLFPAGTTFTPYSVLRNVGEASISLKPSLWWMQNGKPQSAELPPLTLSPLETRSLDLLALLASVGLQGFNGSVNLVFDGEARRGCLVMASGSVDQTNTYVFEVVPRGAMESAAKSIQYWSTGNGDDTMVTIWNPADEAQDFHFTLFFTGGHYTLPLHLEPRATRAFNISEIIQNQIPDEEGNVIPPSIHEGSAKISGSLAETQHILVTADVGVYNVRKGTCTNQCQECDGFSQVVVVDDPFSVAVSGTHQQNVYATWNTGGQYLYTSSASWSSSNTAIATVNNGTNKGRVTGVSPGSVTVSFLLSYEPLGIGYVCTGPQGCPLANFSGMGGGTVPSLQITGVSPSSLVLGAGGQMTITGTGFQAFPGASAQFDNGTAGISIVSQTLIDAGHIQVNYNVNCSAAVGSNSHIVTVVFSPVDGTTPHTNAWPLSMTVPSAPSPRIMFGGNDITGTTQSVVVGQQIALSSSVSLPNCFSIAGQQWTPSSSATTGTPTGGYSASLSSGAVTPLPTNTNSTYSFYWVYPANSIQATYQYTMSSGSSSVSSPLATATFNIGGPTGGTMISTAFPRVTVKNWGTCAPDGAGPYFVYGSLVVSGNPCTQTGTFGMSFSPSGYSNFAGGDWWFVQLINSQTITVGTDSCTSTPGKDGPYPNATSPPAPDAPFVHLLATDSSVTRSFNATMHLMWKSSTSASIPVPLGKQVWAFSGSASCSTSCGSAGNWTATTTGTPGPVGSFVVSTAQQPSYGYPTWAAQSNCQ